MKKILLLLSFIMYISNLALSQHLSLEGYLNINNSLPNAKIEQPPNNIISASTGYTSVLLNDNPKIPEMQMRQGLTTGAVINYQFSQRLEFLTGFEFSVLRYKQRYSQSYRVLSGASYVSAESILSDTWIRVQLGYLSVPLDLQIHLKKKFYLKTGVSLDYLVFVNKRWQELNWYSIYSDIIRNGQIDNQQFSELEEKEVISKEKENFSGFNATIRTGVGYEFSDRLGLELTYRRQIKKLYKKSRSTIDMSFLELGIRVKLKK